MLSKIMLNKQKKRLEKSKAAQKIIYGRKNRVKNAITIELQQEFNIIDKEENHG